VIINLWQGLPAVVVAVVDQAIQILVAELLALILGTVRSVLVLAAQVALEHWHRMVAAGVVLVGRVHPVL
jgi:hypothetical protein